MNLHRQTFTKEQVLEMPVFETAAEAPKDKTPFFLTAGHIEQKEHLLEFIEKLEKAPPEEKKSLAKMGVVKVSYWIRHKDGNVSDCIGIISMKSIIDSMKSTTDEIMEQLQAAPKPEAKEIPKTFELEIPDNDLTFKG